MDINNNIKTALLILLAIFTVFFGFTNITLAAEACTGSIQIYGQSMEPTLLDGEVYKYKKMEFSVKTLEYNDILIFIDEDDECLKRLIGLPGDLIEHRLDGLYRNNTKVYEYYLDDNNRNYIPLDQIKMKTVIVADDSVYVLGDNRYKSFDSRYYKNPNINIANITGKIIDTSPIEYANLYPAEEEYRREKRLLRRWGYLALE